MSVTRKHTFQGVVFNATLIGGLTQQNIALESESRGEATSGELYNRFISMISQRVAPGFTSYAIASLLDQAGLNGVSIADLAAGFAMYAHKHLEGGSRTAGATHRKYSFTKGIVAPRTLNVDHRGDATITYELVVTYDGSNDPIVITDTSALPGALTDAERFTLGPATIGGISLPQLRSLTVDFGLDVVTEGSDSELWDTFASLRAVNSVVTLRGIDIEWLKSTNIPLAGRAATFANSSLYLRKRALGGSFVANATAEHIKIIPSGLAVIDPAFDAGGDDAAQSGVRLQTYYDGTNAPLAIDTAAAI